MIKKHLLKNFQHFYLQIAASVIKILIIIHKKRMFRNSLSFMRFSTSSLQYDVIIAGANLGAILANHIAQIDPSKKVLLCYDNPFIHFHPQRSLYESAHCVKSDVYAKTKSILNSNIDHTNGVAIKRFRPKNSELVLKDGKVIKYKQLVIAMGQKKNIKMIKGFEDAWSDEGHPLYTCRDHFSWKSSMKKTMGYSESFGQGQSIFYIPPTPFFGEIENYNFLMSHSIWKDQMMNGKMSSQSQYTIINANKQFSKHCPEINQYFNNQIFERDINLKTGLKLVEIQKNIKTAIFQELNTGKLIKKVYSNFYSLLPSRPHYRLIEAGLTTNSGQLSVNHHTLRHREYNNIFGLGDVNDLPTTKTFLGGVSQLNVVRANLIRALNNQPLNKRYDGHALSGIFTSSRDIVWLSHFYGGITRAAIFDFYGTLGRMQYERHIDLKSKQFRKIYSSSGIYSPLFNNNKVDSDYREQPLKAFCQIHPLA